jgi:hypothetical protein
VLYQTESYFYVASHDHSRRRWRLAKINRKSDSLEVSEDRAEYSAGELRALMAGVGRGNEVGRCSFTLSKPMLKAPGTKRVETGT